MAVPGSLLARFRSNWSNLGDCLRLKNKKLKPEYITTALPDEQIDKYPPKVHPGSKFEENLTSGFEKVENAIVDR